MALSRTRVAAVMVVGGMMAACQSKPKAQPAASTVAPMDQQAVAQLQRTYRASHPGSEVGVVNAALPDRHIISVTGIPLNRVHVGDVVNIMSGGGNGGTVPAVVYNKSEGYVQLRYEPQPPGQPDPAVGNLAVWAPGGAAVPPDAVAPPVDAVVPTVPPRTTAAEPIAPPPPPPPPPTVRDANPPSTMPLMDAAPATRPAIPQDAPPPPQTAPPPTTGPATLPLMPLDSPPLVVPETRPARPDLNK